MPSATRRVGVCTNGPRRSSELRPRLTLEIQSYRLEDNAILYLDAGLKLTRIMETAPTGQMVVYTRAGSQKRYAFPQEGNVSKRARVLRELLADLHADPEALAVLTARESGRGPQGENYHG